MKLEEVLHTVVKDHPFIDFEREHHGEKMEYWCLCPCGFSTRHFKTKKSAHKDFKNHIVEEINTTLQELHILVRKDDSPSSVRI